MFTLSSFRFCFLLSCLSLCFFFFPFFLSRFVSLLLSLLPCFSIFLLICLFVCLLISFFVELFLDLFVHLFVCFFLSRFVCLFVSRFVCLVVCMFLGLFVCLLASFFFSRFVFFLFVSSFLSFFSVYKRTTKLDPLPLDTWHKSFFFFINFYLDLSCCDVALHCRFAAQTMLVSLDAEFFSLAAITFFLIISSFLTIFEEKINWWMIDNSISLQYRQVTVHNHYMLRFDPIQTQATTYSH